MTNRKQPFGYKIRRGKPVIYETEADIVRQIFKAYLSGASYSTIADMLRGQAISYDEGKPWNKNMIARILGDRRYIENDVYPQIICRRFLDSPAAKRVQNQGMFENSGAKSAVKIMLSPTVRAA